MTATHLSCLTLACCCYFSHQPMTAHAANAAHIKSEAFDREAPRELTYLGYLTSAHAPQVQIQTNEQTPARLTKVSSDTYALHVQGTQLTRHVFSLPIDTSCFAGPIRRITAMPQEEPDSGLLVEILLAKPASLRLHQHGRNWFVTALPIRNPPRL